MEFIEVLNAVIANGIVLIVLIYALINIHISKYHLKVMDRIVYGRQPPNSDDNYVFKAMRTIEYMGFFIRKRLRERLPIKTQKEIMALDKKFRRPFMMLWWLYIFIMIIMVIIFILEVFPKPDYLL
jgi:predicted nucleic acid-binding Zn ribbon protein